MDNRRSTKISNVFTREDLSESQLKELEESVKPNELVDLASGKTITQPNNLNFFLNALNDMHPVKGKGSCTGPGKLSGNFHKNNNRADEIFYEMTFDEFNINKEIANKLRQFDFDKTKNQSKITYRLSEDGRRYEFIKLECAPKYASALSSYFYNPNNDKLVLDLLSEVENLSDNDFMLVRKHALENMNIGKKQKKSYWGSKFSKQEKDLERQYYDEELEEIVKEFPQNAQSIIRKIYLLMERSLRANYESQQLKKGKKDITWDS